MPVITGTPTVPDTGRTLSKQEIQRYSRHLIMPEVGMEGQLKLAKAKVLMIGAGGLGAPLGLYLASAGVGRLGIVDFDVVDFTNLQRQITFSTSDVGRPKIQAAKERLAGMNPQIRIDTYETRLTSSNALDLFREYDIIVDGTDNFPTRYLVNDACVLLNKPNVYGSIFRFEGQTTVFHYPGGPCYRCLYPEPPPPGLVPSCAEGGVLGVLPGIVGALQAMETIKLILGIGEPLSGRLLLFDALGMRFRELRLRRNPSCPVCGDNPTIHELIDYEEFCGIRGEEFVPVTTGIPEITPSELKARLDRGDDLVYSGRARTARVPDLQSEGPPDSARRPAASVRASSIAHAKLWPIAAAESVQPTRCNSCSRPASARFGISRAASWPGRMKSIRPYRSID